MLAWQSNIFLPRVMHTYRSPDGFQCLNQAAKITWKSDWNLIHTHGRMQRVHSHCSLSPTPFRKRHGLTHRHTEPFSRYSGRPWLQGRSNLGNTPCMRTGLMDTIRCHVYGCNLGTILPAAVASSGEAPFLIAKALAL